MLNNGWISIHRQIQDHWLWKDPKKFQWWVDILLTVNHTPTKVNIGNELIECNRGQSVMSLLSWSIRWKVSKGAARNFLKLLQNDNMIVIKSYTKTTRITVCKYDDYQQTVHDAKTLGERSVNAKKTLGDPNNNDNKNNKVNKEEIASDFDLAFNDFLEMRKKIKKPATEKAIFLVRKKLNSLAPENESLQIEIINQSTMNCYQDVFPLKRQEYSNGTTPILAKVENRAISLPNNENY